MAETLLEELKRYVGFGAEDEVALRALHPVAQPHFERIAATFYQRILEHDGAREALVGGESVVGRLKITLVAWMDRLLSGPWDDDYFEARCRIGRVHVRIALPQHYMFGAMNIVRQHLVQVIERDLADSVAQHGAMRMAIGKVLDMELAIMLHTYREDLLAQQARNERLSVFGQLVGSIGHELRNPLGVMETSLFILKQRMGTDERAQKHANRIGEQLGVANQIISDLLDLIRDRPLQRETTSLSSIVAAATSLLTPPQGVVVSVKGLDQLPSIPGDASQLRQVFSNLIENGIYAASPTGEVRVQGRDGGMVEISVEDTGSGLTPEMQRRLFEPLMTTKAKGIGLGLPLVKRIVERHGGTVHCVSEPGRGARFIVRLPKA